jgi:hypothetical protein
MGLSLRIPAGHLGLPPKTTKTGRALTVKFRVVTGIPSVLPIAIIMAPTPVPTVTIATGAKPVAPTAIVIIITGAAAVTTNWQDVVLAVLPRPRWPLR